MEDVPERFKNVCGKIVKIFHQNKKILFILTEKSELIECQNKEVRCYLNLIQYDSRKLIAFTKNTRMDVIQRIDRLVICLIHFKSTFFAIARTESTGFIILSVIHNLVRIQVNGSAVHYDPIISLFHNNYEEKTSFYKQQSDSSFQQKYSDEFKKIEKSLNRKKKHLWKYIENIKRQQKLKIYCTIGNQKFLPRLMRTFNEVFDVAPLVKFGSIFIRVCNEKIAIGVPVLNQSSHNR